MLILKYKWLSAFFAVFAITYLLLAVLVSPDKAVLDRYHITSGQAIALTLTIAIPYLVIWLIALLGYLGLQDYTASIGASKDGAAFSTISKGILLLTLWLPLSALWEALFSNYYHAHPAATANLVRLDNYATLAILFPAFLLINRGAQKLLKLVKRPSYQIPQKMVVLYISLAALYVFVTLSDPARQAPTEGVRVATYYLPDWVTVTTIVIPRLIMWFLGIQAIYFVYLYRQKVKGALYKHALDKLARGIAWVVVASALLRCLQSLASQISDLSLGLLLALVYVLLIVISIGYILIAKGAKSLQQIEEA